MNSRVTDRRRRNGNQRTIIALASCVLGIGLMLLGLSAESGPREKPASAQNQANGENQNKRKLPTWNMALGNIVVVARELGFSVQVVKGPALDEGKLASRIEGKLQSLRELFRRESENHHTLMGAMMLQLTVNAGGKVTNVQEMASRITDSEFKKAVVAEISTWNFGELVPDAATIHCPLLFVREGMDITTLVNWEKSLGEITAKSAVAKNSTLPTQQNKPPDSRKATDRGNKTVRSAMEQSPPNAVATQDSGPTLYQIKYETTIRKEPSFSSPALAKFTTGIKVAVVGRSGDWFQVRNAEGGPSGYLRKEFLTPVAMVKN